MKKIITLNLYKERRLEQKYDNVKAIVNNNAYLFKIDNIKTSLNDDFFIREDNNFKFKLDIKNKKATYLLKENNMLFDIDVLNISYKNNKNNIELKYKLSSDEENFKIEILVKGEINE